MASLAGKRVLITGGAGGIGLCTAQAFLAEGSEVILTDIRQEALDEIETVRLAMNGPDPEIHNPFRAILTANQNPNPFSMKRLSVESNPFQTVAAR